MIAILACLVVMHARHAEILWEPCDVPRCQATAKMSTLSFSNLVWIRIDENKSCLALADEEK